MATIFQTGLLPSTKRLPSSKPTISVLALIALAGLGLEAQTVTGCASTPTADPVVRAAPTVFHASDTVDVNQTVQLSGDSMNSARKQVTAMGFAFADAAVTVPSAPPVFAASGGTCLTVSSASASTARVLLPAVPVRSGSFGPRLGLYGLQLGNSSGASAVMFLNRAESWWVIGSIADTSGAIFPAQSGGTADKLIPGQNFRVFGRNLFASPQFQGWLQGNGSTCKLTYELASSNNWSASFQLPKSCGLKAGSYTLAVHNGLGGQYGFGKTLPVTVGVIPASWPTATYNVKSPKYGAAGNGMHDDTAALKLALADAKNGGTVAVPPGTYLISSKLTIPAYVILRGTGTDQTQAVLVSSENGAASVIAGNGNFNVQNLTLQTATAHRVITCPDAAPMYNSYGLAPPYPALPCTNVLIDHVTINHNTPLSVFNGSDVGNGSIHTYGGDITVQYSSVTPHATAPLLLYNSHHVVIYGNTLYDGNSDADGFFDADQSIYEANLHTATPGTLGNAVYVQGKSHYMYVANNTIQNSLGQGGEGFVAGDSPYVPDALGMPSGLYSGTNAVSDPPKVTFANAGWQANEFAGEPLYVLSGKGALQRNYVASNTADTLSMATLWQVPLDSSSVVDLVKDHSEGIFYNNSFTNVSVSVDLYAQSYGFVVDNNVSSASGGSYCQVWNHVNAVVNGPVLSNNGTYKMVAQPSASYGPVNLLYTDYTVPNGQPLIAQQSNRITRNDVSGFVGLEFTVGGLQAAVRAGQYTVSQLGRMCVAGNSGSHVVKLASAGGADLGAVTVSMAGCTPGRYVYGKLANPVVLNYVQPFLLVSQETAGGDKWYDAAPVTPSAPLNFCYFNQWTNNRISGSLDSANPNKKNSAVEILHNKSITGPLLDPANLNSPSPTLAWIPSASGNEVRNNTLASVAQGYGAGSAMIGGVYNVDHPSPACASILLPNGGVTGTLVEGNRVTGAATPIWFWNYFGDTFLRNNKYQGTAVDFSFTNCVPSVAITAPGEGTTVSGSVTIGAISAAKPPAVVTSVQLQLDGANIFAPLTSPPYQAVFNSTNVANGQHYLSAVSTDSKGLTAQAPAAVITVANRPQASVVTPNAAPAIKSSAPDASPLLASFQPGTIRNNFSGYVGMEFTTGATAISVTSLGRLFLGGNKAAHVVKLVRASDGADVAGATATIAASNGMAGAFTYAKLASPVTLAANTSYYLLSEETAGGDQWYDVGGVSPVSGAATIVGPTYSAQGGYFLVGGSANLSYVTVNLLYAVGK